MEAFLSGKWIKMASNGETAVEIAAVIVALVVILVLVIPEIDDIIEPQLDGQWKESYENTKLWTVAIVIIAIVSLVIVAILYFWGKR